MAIEAIRLASGRKDTRCLYFKIGNKDTDDSNRLSDLRAIPGVRRAYCNANGYGIWCHYSDDVERIAAAVAAAMSDWRWQFCLKIWNQQ